MHRERLESFAFFAIFAAVSLLLYFVFEPFIQILTLAAVFAVLLQKPYERLSGFFKGERTFSAALIVAIVLLFFILPIFLLGVQIFIEAQNIYYQSPGSGTQLIQTVQDTITNSVRHVYPAFTFDAQAYIGNALTFISSNLASLVSGTFYIVLDTFLMMLAFFFFLRDGKSLSRAAVSLSPLGEVQTHEIMEKMYITIESVVLGTLFVGLVRLVLVAVGFFFFGIPNVLLWGSIGGIVGIIPGLGTPFVFIPAVIYLYLQGDALAAIGLAIFGLGTLMLVDNILTPYFFGKGLEVPQVFVLFSILGGILFFGPIGFIMGPLVLSIFVSVLHIYSAMPKPVSRKKVQK